MPVRESASFAVYGNRCILRSHKTTTRTVVVVALLVALATFSDAAGRKLLLRGWAAWSIASLQSLVSRRAGPGCSRGHHSAGGFVALMRDWRTDPARHRTATTSSTSWRPCWLIDRRAVQPWTRDESDWRNVGLYDGLGSVWRLHVVLAGWLAARVFVSFSRRVRR